MKRNHTTNRVPAGGFAPYSRHQKMPHIYPKWVMEKGCPPTSIQEGLAKAGGWTWFNPDLGRQVPRRITE